MSKRVSLRPLTPEERQQIEALAHSRTAPARTVERAQIIRAAAGGQGPAQVARDLGVSRPTVDRWVARFNLQGLTAWRTSPEPDARPPTPRSRSPRSWPPR